MNREIFGLLEFEAGAEPRQRIRFVDPAEASISVLDLAASRGDGIFESISTASGRPLALDAHLERFARSARMLELPQPDQALWREAVLTATERLGAATEGVVKIVLGRGIEGATPTHPSGWLHATVPGDYGRERRDGIDVIVLDRGYRHDVAQTSPWLLQGAKTLSYAINRAAEREAIRRGADDVVFLSSDGYLLEGPRSNLVLRRGGTLLTPRTDLGILEGTTQLDVFEFAGAIGLSTEYAVLRRDALDDADGAWLVSSVRHAAPIRSVDGIARATDAGLTERMNRYLLARTG